jgi:hypothetical protein
MSSESNGRKTDASDSVPYSATQGPRSNSRVASAWGAARDALAAVRNLETLFRSAVPGKAILDLVPELRTGAGVLREAFERALSGDPAAAGVGAQGRLRVGMLERLLDDVEIDLAGVVPPNTNPRADLAGRAGPLADELEAAIELLVLLDRAAAPVATEVTLNLVATEMGRMSGSARGREVILRFHEARPDRAIHADPYVLGPLLALLVAYVQSTGVESMVLRAQSAPRPRFVVEAARASDATLPALAIRVMHWMVPTEAAARHVAGCLGAVLELAPRAGSIAITAD